MSSAAVSTADARELTELLVASYDDPAPFIDSILLAPPLRGWQEELCSEIKSRMIAGDRKLKILVRTAHGVGKTYEAACLMLWFLTTRPQARGLTLAQGWSGVEKLLWPNVAKLFNGSLMAALGWGRLLNTQLEYGPDWFALGASSDRPENLEGHHSPTAAIRIVDEAKAVEDGVFEATEGLLDAPESIDLWISTPSIAAGRFFKRDTDADEDVIRVKVDIDQLIAEGVPGKAEWKAERVAEWGEESPEFQSRVMANYIDNAEGALFPVSWLERAMAQTWDCGGPVVAGMDVAGSVDGDANAVALVQGPDPSTERFRVLSITDWKERDTSISRGKAIAIARPFRARLVVDEQGLGQGVGDQLRADGYGSVGYRAAWKARDPERFLNRKAEDHWNLREALEKGTIRIMAGRDGQKLLAQARAVKYEITQAGKIRINDPEDSPDLVDALSIAFASAGRGEFQSATVDTSLGDSARAWKESGM